MNKLVAIAWIFMFSAGMISAKDLTIYKATYQKQMEAITMSRDMKTSELKKQYLKALQLLAERSKQAGDLEKYQATTKEIERFSENNTLTDANTTKSFASLKNTQLQHLQNMENLQRDKAKQAILLAKRYDGALAKLQTTLTKQNKLEEAMLVLKERKQISRAGVVNKSKAVLAKPKQQRKRVVTQIRQKKLMNHGRHSAIIYTSTDDKFEMYLNGQLILDVLKRGNQLFSQKATLRAGDVLTVKAINTKGYGAFGALILLKTSKMMLPSSLDTWKTYTPTDKYRWYLAKNIGETKAPVLATKEGWPREHIKRECDVYIDNLWGAEDLKIHYFTYTINFEDFSNKPN